jgi:DNA-binding protein YbaB
LRLLSKIKLMFNKVKQGAELIKLHQQAKRIQQQLEQIHHSEEREGMEVTVNGAQNVVRIVIDGEERKDLVDLINKAMKEVQKKSAKKMMEMGGGLGGLLGGQ